VGLTSLSIIAIASKTNMTALIAANTDSAVVCMKLSSSLRLPEPFGGVLTSKQSLGCTDPMHPAKLGQACVVDVTHGPLRFCVGSSFVMPSLAESLV
jgi:hypothetical protein